MKAFILFLAIIMGLLLIALGSTLIAPQATESLGNYDGLSALKFVDVTTGEEASLSDFLGTPLVVNLWVSWNSYCKDELVDFIKLQKEFGSSVRIIALNNGEKDELVSAFLVSHPDMKNLLVWFDRGQTLFNKIDGKGVPETLFIDKTGRVTKYHRGHITYDQIKHSIEALTFEE